MGNHYALKDACYEGLSAKQMRIGEGKQREVVHGVWGRNLGRSSKEIHVTTKNFEVISSS